MDMPVSEFAAADAKARFSELLARAERGEAITIKRHGRAVAQIVPVPQDEDNARIDRQRAMEEFIAWAKARPVYPGRLDYKAMINKGRR